MGIGAATIFPVAAVLSSLAASGPVDQGEILIAELWVVGAFALALLIRVLKMELSASAIYWIPVILLNVLLLWAIYAGFATPGGAVVIGLIGLVLFHVVLGLFLYSIQRRLIYHPDAERYGPAESGLPNVDEVILEPPDGARLIAWNSPPADGMPTLLYFHGNAGGLINRAERIRRFAEAGYGVFMPAYRGYGGSTGKPSEAALIADAALAYSSLREAGVAPRHIVAYGESLGSGVAVQLAASQPVGALILDAPYTSLPDIGKRLYPFLPVRSFMIDRFESIHHIRKVDAPVLILHGTHDTTIPIELGRELYEAASEPKEMAELEGAGHSDIYMFGALERLRRFLERHGLAMKIPEPARSGF